MVSACSTSPNGPKTNILLLLQSLLIQFLQLTHAYLTTHGKSVQNIHLYGQFYFIAVIHSVDSGSVFLTVRLSM